MTDEQRYREMIAIIEAIRKFPIGGNPKDRNQLLCKAEIIAYLSPYQEQCIALAKKTENANIEESIKVFLGESVALRNNEVIPDIRSAERYLNLSPGFIQDIAKVQIIKEQSPEFMETYDLIVKQLQSRLEMQNRYSR